MSELGDLLAEAEEVIASPDTHMYNPVLMLKLLVAIAKELQGTKQ